ncbi:MAG: hypothetical protein M0C28_46280 [Candidatus Moduliflexus flocculans]|nr:hypothetical protein [Candidatus Moduliflexus flocculans]
MEVRGGTSPGRRSSSAPSWDRESHRAPAADPRGRRAGPSAERPRRGRRPGPDAAHGLVSLEHLRRGAAEREAHQGDRRRARRERH